MSDAPAYVYLLWCGRPPARTLYCGWTTDVARRLEVHRTGRGARYTRSRAPLDLAAVLPMPDAGAARREEARIKALRRPQKLALVAALERAQVSASTSTSTTSSPSTPDAIVATGHERRQ